VNETHKPPKLKAIFFAFLLCAGFFGQTVAVSSAPSLRDGLFAGRPVEGRRFAAPPVARYMSEDGEGFVLDRSQSRPLLKFDASPEIWALQSNPAPRGDIIYKNDLGVPVLRATRLGGVTVFTAQRPDGSAAALAGSGTPLRLAPVGPVALAERIYQSSTRASRAARRTIPFFADNATPTSSALIGDAATVTAEAFSKLARRTDGFRILGRVAKVVFVEGRKAAVIFDSGVVRITLAPGDGLAGRPSSERIITAVAGA